MSVSNKIPVWKIKTFKELSTQELYKIIQARVEVFVIEQNCPYQDLDNTDQAAIHLWAEIDHEVVAYCRIFDAGIKYEECSIGRVLTTEKGRGKNLGRQMMKFAVEVIENRFRKTSIRISAQDYLLKFYQEFGFESTGKNYLEDDLPHTEMLRK